MADETQQVLTIDELSDYLRISKSSLYKLAQEGKVPGQKVGRHWRFHRSAIDDWLRSDHLAAGRSPREGGQP
jgi:excisionase family DNA binding protein